MKNLKMRNLTFLFLGLAALGYLSAPAFIGFSLIPLGFAFIFAALAGLKTWKDEARSLVSPPGLARLKAGGALGLGLALLLWLGSMNLWPTLDFSPQGTLTLAPETKALLVRLDIPVSITINLSPQSTQAPQIRELMSHYVRESSKLITVNYVNPQTQTDNHDPQGPQLVQPHTALITALNFRENISTPSQRTINLALVRLLQPQPRLVYFLQAFGEKMVQNRGFGGLSQWGADMADRKLMAQDSYWPEGAPLPVEASVLILAGPKAPLGEIREKQLLSFIKNGGKLLLMVDPLTVSLSSDFWAHLGLSLPDGLVVDPEANLSNTGEGFVVTRDFAEHAVTKGLTEPMLWPLAGAFISVAPKSGSKLTATFFVLALSSSSGWLETDPSSFSTGQVRYQAGQDIPGPLTLALAAEIEGGGRIVALTDSDLATNGFRGITGNRNFTDAALNWLLDGEQALSILSDPGQSLVLSPFSARLIFWLPVVVWPVLVLLVWGIFYRRRRSG